MHHITVDALRHSFFVLNKRAPAGIDAQTWGDYAGFLEENLGTLHPSLHRCAYRALPSRRVYSRKPEGEQRPLGVAAIEDKIVQAAVVSILTPIYEAEFLGFN
jgi:RNA-directed DNA polymerase